MHRVQTVATVRLRRRDQKASARQHHGGVRDRLRLRVALLDLPMDMEQMNAGRVRESIDLQHARLGELRDTYPKLVIPFAAADARQEDVVEKTKHLIEEKGFRGIKPPERCGATAPV